MTATAQDAFPGAGRIAYQGEPGANSHLVCRQRDPDWEAVPCASFEDVFAAVAGGDGREPTADLAMIENLHDLRILRGAPVDGVLPAGIVDASPKQFEMVAQHSLSPAFGGQFDADKFEERMRGLL